MKILLSALVLTLAVGAGLARQRAAEVIVPLEGLDPMLHSSAH